jgi:hypothetical protein
MSASDTSRRRWFEWPFLPLKVFVLLALPLAFFADSRHMPWLTTLDMSLDMFVGWICLLCFLVFLIAAVIQRFLGPEGAARRSIWFAVLAFILGAILSPLFSRA